MSVPLLFPDYQNSILNIPCTLLKHFGLRAPHGTLAVLEQELAAHHYQNIVLMVFDGMGMAVLEKNLPPESFFAPPYPARDYFSFSSHHRSRNNSHSIRLVSGRERLAGMERLV